MTTENKQTQTVTKPAQKARPAGTIEKLIEVVEGDIEHYKCLIKDSESSLAKIRNEIVKYKDIIAEKEGALKKLKS
jgi:hypothetical protein